MGLDATERMIIETRVAGEAPSSTTAFLLWFLLGIVSAHRFYLGRPWTALLQILSYLVAIGFIWWIVDAFLITGMICGVRIEHIEDPLMREIRYLDKLIDELAKGRPMTKILRG